MIEVEEKGKRTGKNPLIKVCATHSLSAFTATSPTSFSSGVLGASITSSAPGTESIFDNVMCSVISSNSAIFWLAAHYAAQCGACLLPQAEFRQKKKKNEETRRARFFVFHNHAK